MWGDVFRFMTTAFIVWIVYISISTYNHVCIHKYTHASMHTYPPPYLGCLPNSDLINSNLNPTAFIVSNISCFHKNVYFIDCRNSDVRLNGFAPSQGLVEVCVDGVWSSICGTLWGVVDAMVTCRQLGYTSTGMSICNNLLVLLISQLVLSSCIICKQWLALSLC